jgi:phage-related protein
MAVISSLDVLLKGNTSNLDQALDKSTQKVKDFGKEGSGGLSLLQVGLAGIAAAATAAGVAFASFVSGRMNAIEETHHLSEELGISTNALIGLQHAASQSGVDAETLRGALEHLSHTGQTTDQAFSKIFAADPANRAKIAFEEFGRSGVKLLPMLKDGAEGLKNMAAEAQDMGITLSDKDIAAVEAGNQAWKRMGDAMNGIGNRIAVMVAPMLEKAADVITYVFQAVQEGISNAQPYLVAIWDTASAFFSMLGEMATPMVEGIVSVIGEWNKQLGDSGFTFENVKTVILACLFGLEYEFKHWSDVITIGVDFVELSFVVFGNNISHLFTVQIPGVFSAFATAAKQFFQNLSLNVTENAKAIWEAIKGGKSPELVWHDMTSGFSKAMQQINNDAKRPMTDLERELTNKIQSNTRGLGKGMMDYVRQKLKEFGVSKDDMTDKAAENTGATESHKGTAAIVEGSVEAYKMIFGSGDKADKHHQENMKAAGEHKVLLKQLVDQGNKQGPKLAVAKL